MSALTNQVVLVKVTEADLELLLAWRRSLSDLARRDDDPPSWEQHYAWFRQPYHTDWLIQYEGRKVGTVAIKNGLLAGYVSIHVAEPELRGRGVATQAITQAMNQSGWETFMAEVHADNTPSQNLFRSLGFWLQEPFAQYPWQMWKREP